MTDPAAHHRDSLPDPLTFADGSAVVSPENWNRRRTEIADLIIKLEYGGLPPSPENVVIECLHTSAPVRRLHRACKSTFRLCIMEPNAFCFGLTIFEPDGDGPFPLLLSGDGCWSYMTAETLTTVLEAGFAYGEFNRCELAHDRHDQERAGGLYDVYPDATFGAIAAWAWGYHRVVDALRDIETIDSRKIAITGHSRGGKASLLAGATDTRIALTHSNGSGCGGAGSHMIRGDGAERLGDMLRFKGWFGPRIWEYIDCEEKLPFDQHFLKALIAPRALLCTEAREDRWANPEGSRLTHDAVRPVYELLGAESRLKFSLREGRHTLNLFDWQTVLDFAIGAFRRDDA